MPLNRGMATEIRRPAWSRLDPLTITDAQLAEMKAEYEACEAHNRAIRTAARQQQIAILDGVKAVWGEGSNAYKYMRRQMLPSFYVAPFEDMERRVIEARRKAAAEQAERARDEQTRQMTQEAVVWLHARGRTLGVDFNLDTAIAVADEIAFNDEVARAKAAGGFHDFNGQNCEGECPGWDGVSHRCACGNRRVGWTMSDWHSFKQPGAHAEAY